MIRRLLVRARSDCIRLAACRHGGPALELGIVLPVLTLMIVGAIYAGWLIFSTNMLFFAVESAARCASVNTTSCGGATQSAQISNIQTYAVAQSWGLSVTTGSFTVTQPANGCGWQVSATYPFLFLMPFQTNFTVTITASACYPNMS